MKICGVKGCTETYACKGLCGFHYKREITGIPLDRPKGIYQRGQLEKICPTCNKTFKVKKSLARSIYCSYSCKGKVRVGANNANWKGGITNNDQQERNRFAREIRDLVFARDDYTCQFCDQYSGYLQVDHIKKWADYPDLRFDLNNCRTLCRACHYYITFKRKMPIGSKWAMLREIGIRDLS